MFKLRPFQRRFVREALAPGIDTAIWTAPRGNGKSALAAHILTRVMDPTDSLFRPGTESVLGAASIEQARIVYRFVRADLEGLPGYRFLDSNTRIGIVHTPTNTRLRVISSNGKSAMGLVNTPYAVLDEPGSYEVVGGELLHTAIQTAQGKPGSPMKAVYIGTLAPATSGWWHDIVADGSRRSTYVQALRGDSDKWDSWPEIRRCNPLTAVSPAFRAKLIEERDAARADSRLKARFLSYRLNIPTPDESTMLLSVDDFHAACRRDVPAPVGKPILGIDLGGGRAWSAAVALWSSGRVECLAVAPGLPGIDAQEKRDRVPRGSYRRLADTGLLHIATGLRVPPVTQLLDAARAAWGPADHIVCDRFRINELRDHARGVQVVDRVSRWSEASEDIRHVRKMFLDGPVTPSVASRPLLIASLSAAMVRNDDQGNVRLAKRDASNNSARDDVAAALVLGCGALGRFLARPARRGAYLGLVG